MKKLICVLSFLFINTFLYAQTSHQLYVQKTANKIAVDEKASEKILNEIKNGKAYLVDVRTPEEFATKHLEYAQNINIRSGNFADEIKKLDKTKTIYLYCRSGNRSGKAADTLQTFGYNFGYNIGGIDSLVARGLPLGNK